MRGELEAEQNCDILTPTLMTITAFLSRSPGLLNRGPGSPASLGHVSHSSTSLQLPDFLSSPGLYNCSTPTFLWASKIALNSTRPRSRLYPDIPRPDAPVIYTGAFPNLTVWPGSICNIIRLFCVVSWSLVGEWWSYPSAEMQLTWLVKN